MKILLFFSTLLVLSISNSYSQDIDEMGCLFLTAIKEKDTASFKLFFPQMSDSKIMMAETLKQRGIEVVDDQKPPPEKDIAAFQRFEVAIQNQILKLRDSAALKGIDWSKVDCSNFSFEISKITDFPFVRGKGRIILKPNTEGGTLVIKEAVRFGKNWKIISVNFE